MTHLDRRNLPVMIAVSVCFALAGAAASAQTLTVVQPTNHIESPPLSSIRGGTAAVNGPTEIPHHPLPLQANYRNSGSGGGGGTGPDAALQTTLGPLINATAGTHFDGMSVYDGGYILPAARHNHAINAGGFTTGSQVAGDPAFLRDYTLG